MNDALLNLTRALADTNLEFSLNWDPDTELAKVRVYCNNSHAMRIALKLLEDRDLDGRPIDGGIEVVTRLESN